MYESSSLFFPDAANLNQVHLAISSQVNKAPEQTAVVCCDKQISFRELEFLSSSVAVDLCERGVEPGSFVALLFAPGISLIISLLAIHKVGAAFVPLSASYPQARIVSMLKTCACRVVLGDIDNRNLIVDDEIDYIVFDDKLFSGDDKSESLFRQNSLDATAYVHFTSGSTGNPKGVNVLHRNLSYYIGWSAAFFKESVGSRLPLTSSIQFAASISQIYSSLTVGETLHILPDYLNEPEKLFVWYAEHQDYGFYCVPTVWKSALDWYVKKNMSVAGPAALFLSGEDVSESLLAETFSCFPEICIWNLYGPTEGVANLSYKKVAAPENCSIGTPIHQTSFYVVKENGDEARVGEDGLLYVSGPGICAGYIGEQKQTEASFFTYSSKSDGIVPVYDTGDIVRRIGSNEYKFVGRQDRQVKVNGQRIELEEIEKCLYRQPQIKTAAVSLISEKQPYIAAYIEFVSGEILSIETLRSSLLQFVTVAMVPDRWVFLDDFPKLSNGKIDRKSLPVPGDMRPVLAGEFIPASGEREEKIVSIFKKILKLDDVGIEDNFFILGGSSLKALALIIEIEAKFCCRLSFKSIFENPTPRALLEQLFLFIPRERTYPEKKLATIDTFSLTGAQRGLLFFLEAYQKSAVYNIACSLAIEGELNLSRLELALERVIERHLPLCSLMKQGGENTCFIREESISIELPVEILECVPELQRERFVEESISVFASLPFSLYNSPLYRAKIYRLESGKHILAWVVNHLIFDGESIPVFLADLFHIYQNIEPVPLVESFADVVLRRSEYRESAQFEYDSRFWQNYLDGVSEIHSFPRIYQPQTEFSFSGRRVHTEIDAQLRENLTYLCRKQGVTLNSLLLAAFGVTLYKFGQREEYVIAAPFSERLEKSESSLVGYFANTLLYRVKCSANSLFSELVESVNRDTASFLDHQCLPFEQLVTMLRQQGVNLPVSVFRTMFALHDRSNWEKGDENFSIRVRELFNQHAKCDLHLECFDAADKIDVELSFAVDVIDESAALQIITVFTQVLREILSQYSSEITALGGITAAESEVVLQNSIAEKVDYGQIMTLSGLFQETCAEFPDFTAISFAETTISYRTLAQKAAAFADRLSKLNLKKNEPLGIFLDNTPELLVAILASSALAHPYIPIDPTYPEERIRYIAKHAEIRYVLTSSELKTEIFTKESRLLFVDEVVDGSQTDEFASFCRAVPDDLLYIIYTSGSTGNPKGVMLPNLGVANYLLWMKDCFNTGTDTRILAKTSISFDISVWELFLPLISGGTLVLEKRADIESPEQTAQIIREKQVNIFQFVPSGLKLFYDVGMFAQTPSLKKIFCGGEKMPLGLKDDVLSQYKGELYNLYGPTEASIFMNCHRCAENSNLDKVSIGKPIPNSSLYVLDEKLNLQPRNMPGDLYIGGDVLATGYLKDSEKTRKAFKPSPKDLPEKIIYATGDRGRMLSCGKFEFLGRNDHQVKIRGYRVELQEIDKAVEKISGVHQAVAYLNQHSEYDTRLYAVVVPKNGVGLTSEIIRRELKNRLPAYMIPSSITLVESIPLLPNGKINQKEIGKYQLAISPEVSRPKAAEQNSKVENLMIEIWSEVLGRKDFTTRDNFFDVGGHSLLFLQIRDLIKSRLDSDFSLVELYQHPNIAALAEQYRNKIGSDGPSAAISAIRNRIARRIRKQHGK